MPYDISIIQGQSYELVAGLTNASGQVVNISGYNLRGQARYSYGSTGILLDLAPQVFNAESGILKIQLSPSQTSALPATVAVYDIEKYSQNDVVVDKVLNGFFTINPEVTR